MRHAARLIVVALAAALLFPGAGRADELELKDGRIITGTFAGGSRINIHFVVDGKTRIFKRSEVVAIFLEERTEATASQPAPAQSAAPSSSRTVTTTTATAGGTIPAGARILVRTIDAVDSDTNSVGDTFRASLEENLTVDGAVVAPAGADIVGRLTEVKEAGRLTGKSELKLELVEIVINDRVYSLTTGEYELAGKGRGGDTAKKVAGGAAIGAVVGAIAGGGKGAAIGAGIGAGAGTAIQIFTRGEQVRVPSETLLEFTLEQDVVVQAPSNRNRRRR